MLVAKVRGAGLRLIAFLAICGISLFLSAGAARAALPISYSPGSLSPDSIFREFTYTVGFTINIDTAGVTIDSARSRIEILRPADSSILGTLFDGAVTAALQTDSTIEYTGLTPQAISWPDTSGGLFTIHLQYTLFSQDSVSTVDTIMASSVRLMKAIIITYGAGTLAPDTIAPGTKEPFSFDVMSHDPYALVVHDSLSRLFVSGTNFNDTIDLNFPYDSLLPAIQSFVSDSVVIGGDQPNDTLHFSASLAVVPKALAGTGATPLTYSLNFGSEVSYIQTPPVPILQIVSLTVVAPNTPRVNIGQDFSVHAHIANRSTVPVGPVHFQLTTDGGATFNPDVIAQIIDANGEIELTIPVTADSKANAGEVFRLSLTSDVESLPPLDDVAFAIVETPANLTFSYTLFGAISGVVGYGQTFSVNLDLRNLGQSKVTESAYLLTTGGVSFGIPDSIGGSLNVEQDVTLSFRAPSYDTQTVFIMRLLDSPIDVNTGLPAPLNFDSLSFPIIVRAPGGDLFVAAEKISESVMTPGRLTDMFDLRASNRVTTSGAQIRLLNMTLDFEAVGGGPLQPGNWIDWNQSGIYRGNQLISVATPSGSRIILSIDDLELMPQETVGMMVRLKLEQNAPPSFTFRQALSDIQAIIVEGTSTRQAQVVSSGQGSFLYSGSYSVVGTSLRESFIVNNNPYDPSEGAALFAYELTEPAPICFCIYTITGERVLKEDYSEGESETTVGNHLIQWNGKNGRGDLVLNGIYIVSLTNMKTGENARLKVAVVR